MIVIHTHRSQLLTLSAVSTLFGVAGLLGARRDTWRIRRWWNLFGSSYFLFHGARLASMAFRPSALVLGREGILDQAGSPPAGFLPWDALLPAEAVQVPMGLLVRKFVGIRLDSVDAGDGGRWRSPWEPPMLAEYAVLIPEYVLDERVEEVVALLNQFIEDASERTELGSLAGAPGKAMW